MKRVMQFRYRGDNHSENYPKYEYYTDRLTDGNIFQDYGFVSKLGIQGPVGLKFYLNFSNSPIMIGQTGIYELDLEKVGRISAIQFDRTDLNKYYPSNANPNKDKILIDIVYEGAN